MNESLSSAFADLSARVSQLESRLVQPGGPTDSGQVRGGAVLVQLTTQADRAVGHLTKAVKRGAVESDDIAGYESQVLSLRDGDGDLKARLAELEVVEKEILRFIEMSERSKQSD